MNLLSPLFFLCSVGVCLQYNVLGNTDDTNTNQNKKSLPYGIDFIKGYPRHCYVKCHIFDYGLNDIFNYGYKYFNIDTDGYAYFNEEPTDIPAIPKANNENYNSGTEAIISQEQTANFTEKKLDQNLDKDTYKKENRRTAQDFLNYLTTMIGNVNFDSNSDNNINQVQSQRMVNEQESINNQIEKSDLDLARYNPSNDKTYQNLKEYHAVQGWPFNLNTFINSDNQRSLPVIDEKEDRYKARFKKWLHKAPMEQLLQQIQEALKNKNVNTNINKLDE